VKEIIDIYSLRVQLEHSTLDDHTYDIEIEDILQSSKEKIKSNITIP